MLGIFSQLLSTLCFRQALSLGLEFTPPARLADQTAPGPLLSTLYSTRIHHCHSHAVLMLSWGLSLLAALLLIPLYDLTQVLP